MKPATLLMIAPAPAKRLSDSRLRLDAKFVEGAKVHARKWAGPVRFLLWEGGDIPFWRDVDEADLGFSITLLKPEEPISARHLQGVRLIAASADMHQVFELPDMAKDVGAKLVYTVEYTLDTRLRILWLENRFSIAKKFRSSLWHFMQERFRRSALRAADGLQFNGWPAQESYQRLNRNSFMYLDSRMTNDLIASDEDVAARVSRLKDGAPIRIVHSGRIESLKGSQDLVPIAQALRGAGVSFTLDIWGAGSMIPDLRDGISKSNLGHIVRVHDPLPFETGLVPKLRDEGDLFLSCHRQGDPSCSYLEAMGCGLPVIGYDNAMLHRLAEASHGARVVRMGDAKMLAYSIADWDRNREKLCRAASDALAFAKAHDFESVFGKRMQHFESVAAST